jgi:hypothetical protein
MRVLRPAPLALAASLLATGLAAGVASAASPVPPARPLPPAPVVAPDAAPPSTPADRARRASELHQQGMEAGAAGKWRRAAALHRRASELHADGDPQGSRCLQMAANLFYADGDLAEARRTMEAAGEEALARGDVSAAADAFLKAGLVARDLRDGPGAAALTRRALLLANSPLLTGAERDAIAARVVQR